MSIGPYDYKGLIQAFLEQSQSEGTTAQNRMSFNGPRLYSYHILLAELSTSSSGETVLLINKAIMNYSNTTKRQVKVLHAVTQIQLPTREWYLNMSPEDNISEILIDINQYITKHKRARVNKERYKETIQKLYYSIEPLIEEYNIDKRKSVYKKYKQLPFVLFANKIL